MNDNLDIKELACIVDILRAIDNRPYECSKKIHLLPTSQDFGRCITIYTNNLLYHG